MEVLQMLKCGLKQERLDFSTGLMTEEETLMDESFDLPDLLAFLDGGDSGDPDVILNTFMRVISQDDSDVDD
jgi:hypothetical protein